MPLAFTDQQIATIQDIAAALVPPHLRSRYLERLRYSNVLGVLSSGCRGA
jgi:hypothetical protein